MKKVIIVSAVISIVWSVVSSFIIAPYVTNEFINILLSLVPVFALMLVTYSFYSPESLEQKKIGTLAAGLTYFISMHVLTLILMTISTLM